MAKFMGNGIHRNAARIFSHRNTQVDTNCIGIDFGSSFEGDLGFRIIQIDTEEPALCRPFVHQAPDKFC